MNIWCLHRRNEAENSENINLFMEFQSHRWMEMKWRGKNVEQHLVLGAVYHVMSPGCEEGGGTFLSIKVMLGALDTWEGIGSWELWPHHWWIHSCWEAVDTVGGEAYWKEYVSGDVPLGLYPVPGCGLFNTLPPWTSKPWSDIPSISSLVMLSLHKGIFSLLLY